MQRWKWYLAGAAAGLLLLAASPLLATEALYAYAVRRLPSPPALPARGMPPSLVVTAFWLSAGERLPLQVEPLSAWRYGWAIAYDHEALLEHRPGDRMASLAAREWLGDRLPRRGVERALEWSAATVWASRHWDAVQLTQVWLEDAWFGRGARGLTAASSAYFGKAPGELALHELALLVALSKAPSRFDPTRYPERARSARDAVLRGLLNAGVVETSDCAAARAEPLGVTPTAPRRSVPSAPAGRPSRSRAFPRVQRTRPLPPPAP